MEPAEDNLRQALSAFVRHHIKGEDPPDRSTWHSDLAGLWGFLDDALEEARDFGFERAVDYL